MNNKNSFPFKQTSALIHRCLPEFEEVVRFNRLMGREVGNNDHLWLQGSLLHEEGLELLGSEINGDELDALCDVAVVATGYLFIAEQYPSIFDGANMDLAPVSKGAVFNACANAYGNIFSYVVESGCEDIAFYKAAIAYARDALWLVVAYCVIQGIDLKTYLAEVNRSNFSKFCMNEELIPTIAKYQRLGVPVEMRVIEDGLHGCYVLSSVTGSDGKFYPQGKLLKSVGFKEPEFVVTEACAA